MTAILAIISAILKLFGLGAEAAKQEHDTQTGINLQRGREAEDALTVERKVANIAAQPVDVDKALSKGGDF